MLDDHGINLSDDEEDIETGGYSATNEVTGLLSKWTNYIHGWQLRYIILKDATLSYYKSENDTTYGCRGAISIHRATIKPHEFDECRFDVSVNDCVWYLRADNAEERNKIDALETFKSESGYGSENSLRRHGSALSLASGNLSMASSSSFKNGRGLREKLAEMETFRDILCRQVDTLQSYFDTCAETVAVLKNEQNSPMMTDDLDDPDDDLTPVHTITNPFRDTGPVNKELLMQHGAHSLDFKGEAITFKATTAGILATLAHCMELMNQREECWRRRLEREVEKQKKREEMYKQALETAQQTRPVLVGGPDCEEGPHCSLNEEEFFDAVDAGLDKLDSDEDRRFARKSLQPRTSLGLSQHPLSAEINRITLEQLHYARLPVGDIWQLFAEEGDMKMFKREVEEDGLVVDPLKAVHVVKGVTGREMCHYFFDPDVRMEWETTLDSTRVVEKIGEDTIVFHQVHKRVWPAAQRDSVFWSHLRRISNDTDPDAHDIYMVCNHTTDHSDAPMGKCVRLKFDVSLVCQTYVDPPEEDKEINRDNLTCKIMYCAIVNPGGWAPASVLRVVFKREYPRFLKRFTQYVKDQTVDKPIRFD